MKRTIIIIAMFLFGTFTVHSQWRHLDGPYAGEYYDMISVNDSVLYCLEMSGYIFTATRDNLHWRLLTKPPDDLTGLEWITVEQDGNLYMLGEELYRYDAVRDNWICLTSNLQGSGHLDDYAVSADGTIYAGDHYFYNSTDEGETWNKIELGGFSTGHDKTLIFCDRNDVFYNSGIQLHVSRDGGKTFTPVGSARALSPMARDRSTNFYIVGDTLVIGIDADGTVIRSHVDDRDWVELYKPGPASISNRLYVSGDNVLWYISRSQPHPFTLYSTDMGETWTEAGMRDMKYIIFSLALHHSSSLIGFNMIGGSVFASSDMAETWQYANDGISRTYVQCTALRDTNFYVETQRYGYRWEAFSREWTTLPKGVHPKQEIVIDSKGVLFARSPDHISWDWLRGKEFYEYVSLQNTDILVDLNDALITANTTEIELTDDFFQTRSFLLTNFLRARLSISPSGMLFGVSNEGQYFLEFSYLDGIDPIQTDSLRGEVYAVASDDWNNLVASTAAGVFSSQDEGQSWRRIRTADQPKFKKIIRDWRQQFYALDDSSDVYHSYDGGRTWVDLRFECEFGEIDLIDLVSDDSLLYASSWGYGLFTHPLPSLTTINRSMPAKTFDLLTYYPSPVGDLVTFDLSRSPEKRYGDGSVLRIRDLLGRVRLSTKVEGTREISVNTSSLSPGIYLFEILAGDRQLSGKLVVDR